MACPWVPALEDAVFSCEEERKPEKRSRVIQSRQSTAPPPRPTTSLRRLPLSRALALALALFLSLSLTRRYWCSRTTSIARHISSHACLLARVRSCCACRACDGAHIVEESTRV